LGVSTYQVWLARQQTLATQRTVEAAITVTHAEARNAVLFEDPELLAWFLGYRGLKGSTAFENKKRLFIFQKLISDEAVYIAYRRGFISATDWAPWAEAVKSDVLVEEGRSVWPAIRNLYAAQFGEYVDSLIRDFEAEQAARADTAAPMGDQTNR
jgi:hypothetical protein